MQEDRELEGAVMWCDSTHHLSHNNKPEPRSSVGYRLTYHFTARRQTNVRSTYKCCTSAASTQRYPQLLLTVNAQSGHLGG